MENANLDLTLQVRRGRVVGHQQIGDDFPVTVTVAGVAHRAVAECLRDNQPPAKMLCRHRPIPIKVGQPIKVGRPIKVEQPIKVEAPITITLSSDEEEEREYIEPELVLPKQEPSEENQEEQSVTC